MSRAKYADLWTWYHQSFCTVSVGSKRGRSWALMHCPKVYPYGHVEHRYIADIIMGALRDGLTVRDAPSGHKAKEQS